MSINQYTSDTPETTSLWWSTQQQQASNPSSAPPPIPIHQWHPQLYPQQQPTWQRFNLNNIQDEDIEDDDVAEEQGCGSSTRSSSPQGGGGGEGEEEEQREAMFEKPLTPSDVGKLNRLVIPKQHAEKYFPLDSSSGETKGLLLSFEDESGKCWRFRYSYWNSSQSYVLTKGWSRYVKDKRLHAGDVVLFHRHRTHAHRFFITWRRRQHTPSTAHLSTTGSFYPAHPYPAHHLPFPYQTDHSLHHTGGGSQSLGHNSQTTPGGNSSSSSSSRVLRLFGVNMECQPDDNNNNNNNNNNDSQTSFAQDGPYNIMSSPQGTATQQFHHHQPPYSSPNTHPHMVRQQPY